MNEGHGSRPRLRLFLSSGARRRQYYDRLINFLSRYALVLLLGEEEKGDIG